jgi:mRNA interferase MazF
MKKPIAASEGLSAFDVVVVPFPYADRLSEKKRPALVVSNAATHDEYGLVWLVMITSAANPRWECDVEISDLAVAGLPAPSVVRPVKIATVDAVRIVRRIGRMSTADVKDVRAAMRVLVGL